MAGTDPTNPASVLCMLSAKPGAAGVTIAWQSVSNRTYFVQRSAVLSRTRRLPRWPLALPDKTQRPPISTPAPRGRGHYFYRVGVDTDPNHLYTPFSVISYDWLQRSRLPTDGTVNFTDTDGDGMNNWQEWIAGTSPTNAARASG